MAREMKDSGIAWIGEIPKEWEVCRLKNECELHGRIGWNGLRSDEFEETSYAYLITGQDFVLSNIDWNKCYQIRQERYDEDEFIQVHNKEILITKDGTVGKIAIVTDLDKPACLNSGIFVMRQKHSSFYPKFLYWTLFSTQLKTYNDFMNLGGTTIIHLCQNVFERMPLLVPTLHEQQSIANFLDKKCGEIDELISLQERMIDELKAYKQSVITETVTKGLNPNVEMKDSGVDWIGEIPMHWDVCRIKDTCNNISDGTHFSPDTKAEGYPYITAGDVHGKGIDFTKAKLISEEDYNKLVAQGCKPNKNDVLIVKDGATTGRVGLMTEEKDCVLLSSVAMLSVNATYYNLYMFYMMQSSFMEEQISLSMAGSAMPRITLTKLNNFITIAPPFDEQRQIASYLDTKCTEIDALITIKQQKIDQLKDYKKSLIYEYVTGKKEVI